MKKKIKRLVLAAVGVLLAVGIAFAIMRPSYVEEAWNILFANELTVENIEKDNGLNGN